MSTNNTTTKERPILFSAEMVRAILDGRKTQTRRVVTVPWYKGKRCLPYEPYYVESDGKLLHMDEYGDYDSMEKYSPYGQPGDRLWVRETWCPRSGKMELSKIQCPFFKADGDKIPVGWKWKPSRFMPRWASRIDLAITSVRVERVQDISESDGYSEGTDEWAAYYLDKNNIDGKFPNIISAFKTLWDSINSKREGCSWADNPWVWVIEFERIRP